MREAINKIAERIVRDPTTGTLEDLKKLARAWLLQTTGRVRQ